MRVGLHLDRHVGAGGSAEIAEPRRGNQPVAQRAERFGHQQPLPEPSAGTVDDERRGALPGGGVFDRAEAGVDALAAPFETGDGPRKVALVERRHRRGRKQGKHDADEQGAVHRFLPRPVPPLSGALARGMRACGYSLMSRRAFGLSSSTVRSVFSRMMPLARSCEMMRDTVSMVRPR